MEMRGIRDKKLLGFDMLEKNLDGLKKGFITTLLTERTATHVGKSMQALINYLVINQKPASKDNMFPIDILNKYNVEFYKEF